MSEPAHIDATSYEVGAGAVAGVVSAVSFTFFSARYGVNVPGWTYIAVTIPGVVTLLLGLWLGRRALLRAGELATWDPKVTELTMSSEADAETTGRHYWWIREPDEVAAPLLESHGSNACRDLAVAAARVAAQRHTVAYRRAEACRPSTQVEP